jgi:hypothetical protein
MASLLQSCIVSIVLHFKEENETIFTSSKAQSEFEHTLR